MELFDIEESRSSLAFAAYVELPLKLVEMLLERGSGSMNFGAPFTSEHLIH